MGERLAAGNIAIALPAFAGKLQDLKSETKSMVRRLAARAVSRIANSPLQVGAQTCTRLLAFREI
jgi:hypothetical protein